MHDKTCRCYGCEEIFVKWRAEEEFYSGKVYHSEKWDYIPTPSDFIPAYLESDANKKRHCTDEHDLGPHASPCRCGECEDRFKKWRRNYERHYKKKYFSRKWDNRPEYVAPNEPTPSELPRTPTRAEERQSWVNWMYGLDD